MKINEQNIKISIERLKIEQERLDLEKKQLDFNTNLEKDKLDFEKNKELYQIFKDLKEKNVKDNFTLNQKINEQNNSYFFKKDNTLDINYLKKQVENNEKELDLLFPLIYKNNSNLKPISENINIIEDKNLVTSVFENMFL